MLLPVHLAIVYDGCLNLVSNVVLQRPTDSMKFRMAAHLVEDSNQNAENIRQMQHDEKRKNEDKLQEKLDKKKV